MVTFLSAEWVSSSLGLWAKSIAPPGPEASVCFALTGAPPGAEGYWWRLEDGALADAGIGVLDDADVAFTLSYKDAVALNRAESDLNAGFMQGRIKVAGDSAKLLSVLALTATASYKTMLSELARQTEFPG